MKNKKNRTVKTVLIVAGIIVALALLHLLFNSFVPFIRQLHGW